MGILSRVAKKAGIGGTTLEVIKQLEKHPEVAAAGLIPGVGIPLAAGRGVASIFGGRKRQRPHVQPSPALPYGLGKNVNRGVMALINGMHATGRTAQGLQPWHVSGYKTIASGTAIAANADITDMFTSANTRLFSADDTFPWTFLSQRFRCAIDSQPIAAASQEDPAWMRQLSLRFVVATEVGRLSLDALGVERVIASPLSGSGGGTASQFGSNPGVGFPVIFEKNGTYQMFLHTDAPASATVQPFAFSYQMDGWVVQNTGLLNDGDQLTNALGELVGLDASAVRSAIGRASLLEAADDDDDDD